MQARILEQGLFADPTVRDESVVSEMLRFHTKDPNLINIFLEMVGTTITRAIRGRISLQKILQFQ